jgi:nucleotide-binding universal stress UspA family protein
MFKHILIATDGSSASEHAAHMAVELARTHGGYLTAVYAIDPYPLIAGGEFNLVGMDSYMTDAKAHARQSLDHIKHLAALGASPVAFNERLIERTAVSTAILDTAKADHCDLIVVGSHGRGAVATFFLGSVASKVVAHSVIPVLVVR